MEFLSVLVAAVGVLATLAGLGLAALAFFSWTQLQSGLRELSDMERRLAQSTEQQLRHMEVEFSRMQAATQKLLAGYEEAVHGRYDEALSLYEDARRIYDRVFNLFNAIGWAHLGKNDIPAAIEAFRKAAELAPDAVEPFSDLAVAYVRTNRPDLAVEAIERALRIDPSQLDYFLLSEMYGDLRSDPRFQRLVGRI